MSYTHIPVMPTEVVHYLRCRPGNTVVDCTLGGSGHAGLIVESIMPDGLLIGIDRDRDAIVNAERVLESYAPRIRLFHGDFTQIRSILARVGVPVLDGILLDLGVSLHQIESSGRGFSFRRDEPLDMRMDASEDTPTAASVVNGMTERDLKRVFAECGEERWAGRIARRIVKERESGPITSSLRLADIVCHAVPGGRYSRRRTHPATRVFMALRIAVNHELEKLDQFLAHGVDHLKPGGRLCILSFHSLEDRIVKHRFRALAKGCVCPPSFPKCVCGKTSLVRLLTKKACRPSEEEVAANPMARSTRLRAVERLPLR